MQIDAQKDATEQILEATELEAALVELNRATAEYLRQVEIARTKYSIKLLTSS